MKTLRLLLLALVGFATTGLAQTVEDARDSARADLEDAIARYSALQEQIRTERVPIDRQLNALNAELRDLRREAERSLRVRDNRTVDLRQLSDRVTGQQEQIDYVANLINDFGDRFDSNLDASELSLYADELEAFSAARNQIASSEEMLRAERVVGQIFILETAIARVDALIGGQTFTATAVVDGGDVEDGTVLALGPTYYFTSNDSDATGLLQSTAESTLPIAVSLGEETDAIVRPILQAGSGNLPIDPTLGNAFAIQAAQDTLWEHIQKGGLWIWPILTFAGLSFLTALFKIFDIYSVKMPRPGALHAVLKELNEGNEEEALKLAESVRGPTKAMLVDAVKHSNESKELVEEIMYERMLELQPRLERLLPFIAVTAATAPLMGLLGTVTGMINTFELITVFGTGDARSLSSGISEALITTEFGLIVAIPSLIIHALLNRRAQGVMANMERMAVAFVNGLNRKA